MDITIVIPAFNSESSLSLLVKRLVDVLCSIGATYSIVIVDDCSSDSTWKVLKNLKLVYPKLKIARLARNSGQHNAILCGFGLSEGEIIITMDDDLQNRPEDIPQLIDAINEGYDLVIGAYETKTHLSIHDLGGWCVDELQRRIFKMPGNFQLTSFRAIRKNVVTKVVQMGGAFPYITSMLLSHTSRYKNINVSHEERCFGTSNYNVKRSALLALNLVFNYSSYPLYFVIGLCMAAFAFSIFLGLWVVGNVLLFGSSVQGWASTMVIISFFNALLLLALALQGIYLSRLNQQFTHSRVAFSIMEVHD